MAGHQGYSIKGGDLHEQLAAAIEAERRDINTMLPGEIVSYDPKTQKATVRPRYKQMIGGDVIQAPNLLEVPVAHARAGGMILHTPPQAGDEVMLTFAQRSLDQSGDDASDLDGAPGRMHDLSDAIATPAAYSKPRELGNLPAKGVFFGQESGKVGLTVSEGGRVDFISGADSLHKVIKDLATAFRDHTNADQGVAPEQVTAMNQIITRLDALAGQDPA